MAKLNLGGVNSPMISSENPAFKELVSDSSLVIGKYPATHANINNFDVNIVRVFSDAFYNFSAMMRIKKEYVKNTEIKIINNLIPISFWNGYSLKTRSLPITVSAGVTAGTYMIELRLGTSSDENLSCFLTLDFDNAAANFDVEVSCLVFNPNILP